MSFLQIYIFQSQSFSFENEYIHFTKNLTPFPPRSSFWALNFFTPSVPVRTKAAQWCWTVCRHPSQPSCFRIRFWLKRTPCPVFAFLFLHVLVMLLVFCRSVQIERMCWAGRESWTNWEICLFFHFQSIGYWNHIPKRRNCNYKQVLVNDLHSCPIFEKKNNLVLQLAPGTNTIMRWESKSTDQNYI